MTDNSLPRLIAKLPEPVRLQVADCVAEALQLIALGDSSAMRWSLEQLAYLARKHPDLFVEMRAIYRALQEVYRERFDKF